MFCSLMFLQGWYEEKPQSIEIPADRQRTSKEVGESKPSVTDATKTSAGRYFIGTTHTS